MATNLPCRSSICRSFDRSNLLHLIVLYSLVFGQAVLAAPQGEQVVNGQADFDRQGSLTEITASHNAIINYQSFDIQTHETVRFIQPSVTSRVLNRIVGPDPTTIAGTLRANGQVYIVNPAGVIFTETARIDVARLVAAAASITNEDFLNNVDHFTDVRGSVVNHGQIAADFVGLIGQHVANYGTILVPEGTIAMVAGDDVLLGQFDDPLMVKITGAAVNLIEPGLDPGIENHGTLEADHVRLSAGDMFSILLDHSSQIRANQITIEGGKDSTVEIGGLLDVFSQVAGGDDGRVTVTVDQQLTVLDQTQIDTGNSGLFEIISENGLTINGTINTTGGLSLNTTGSEGILLDPALLTINSSLETSGGNIVLRPHTSGNNIALGSTSGGITIVSSNGTVDLQSIDLSSLRPLTLGIQRTTIATGSSRLTVPTNKLASVVASLTPPPLPGALARVSHPIDLDQSGMDTLRGMGIPVVSRPTEMNIPFLLGETNLIIGDLSDSSLDMEEVYLDRLDPNAIQNVVSLYREVYLGDFVDSETQESTPNAVRIQQTIAQAWNDYQSNDVEDHETSFGQFLLSDPSYQEARGYVGKLRSMLDHLKNLGLTQRELARTKSTLLERHEVIPKGMSPIQFEQLLLTPNPVEASEEPQHHDSDMDPARAHHIDQPLQEDELG